jgi:multicomponent Na+:H+ antiporter subunit E
MAQRSSGTEGPGNRVQLAARMVPLAVLLASAWLLWSGFFTPLMLLLGLFSCGLVVYLSSRLRLFDSQFHALRLGPRLFRYWAWLAGEIVRSSLEVSRVVLSPRLPISPTLVDIESSSKHPDDRAILGNSITLTPGTLTIAVAGQRLTVHALTRQGAEELLAGSIERRVAALREE